MKEFTEHTLDLTLLAIILLVCILSTYMLTTGSREKENTTYCMQVQRGNWPDFHHSYQEECQPEWGPRIPYIPYKERP